MPKESEFAPLHMMVIRYRCYYCSQPWWISQADAEIKTEKAEANMHNTILALCDPCKEKFHGE